MTKNANTGKTQNEYDDTGNMQTNSSLYVVHKNEVSRLRDLIIVKLNFLENSEQ